MTCTLKQLTPQLRQGLSPVYLISCDEPQLLQSAKATILAHGKKKQFNLRHTLDVGTENCEAFLRTHISNQDLFAEKTILDIRSPKGTWDKPSTQFLCAYLKKPSPDRLIVISCPKFTKAQQQRAWVKAIDQHGVFILIYDLTPNEHLSWLTTQCKQAQLSLHPEATRLLAERTYGHLLAATQAITRLAQLKTTTPIDLDTLAQLICDQAHYSIYELSDACLLGNPKVAMRMLKKIQEKSTAPSLVLWAINRTLRTLEPMILKKNAGQPTAQILNATWSHQKPPLQAALQRMNSEDLQQYIYLSAQCELCIKGCASQNPWHALAALCLAVAGSPLITQHILTHD